jgi:uncharacterized protein YdeI (YjbR/CyaY-like superfamily)
MQALDLKTFIWSHKQTKEASIILAITTYKDDDIVVYRGWKDRAKIEVMSVDDFCKQHEATYQIEI